MEPLRYPVSGESPLRTLGVGIALAALGPLVLPALVVTGYYGRVLVRSSRDEPAPSFSNVGGLLADGLRTWLAIGTYIAIGVGVAIGLGVAALALGEAGTGLGAEVGLAAVAMLALIAVGLFVFPAWYFTPAALAGLAEERRFGAAFDFGSVRRVVFDRRYFLGWLAGCGLLVAGSAVYYALASVEFGVPFVGHVAGAAVNFYCQISAFHCFGRGYAAAADDESEVGETAAGDERRTGESDSECRTSENDPEREADDDSEAWGAAAQRWRERRRERE